MKPCQNVYGHCENAFKNWSCNLYDQVRSFCIKLILCKIIFKKCIQKVFYVGPAGTNEQFFDQKRAFEVQKCSPS